MLSDCNFQLLTFLKGGPVEVVEDEVETDDSDLEGERGGPVEEVVDGGGDCGSEDEGVGGAE